MEQKDNISEISLDSEVGNPFEEIVMLTQLLVGESKRTDALLRRARVLLEMGQLPDAEADMKKAMEQPDGWEKEIGKIRRKIAVGYYERGRMRHNANDDKGAMEDMLHAMEIAPEMEKKITGRFNK